MSTPDIGQLLTRIQALELRLSNQTVNVERQQAALIDRSGTTGNLTGVLRRSGSTWVQAATAAIDVDSLIGYAIPANSGKTTVYTAGALWIDHAFAVGSELYLSPTTPGLLTETRPTAAAHSRRIIAYAGAKGWIWLANSGEGQQGHVLRMADVENVDPASLADDDILAWDLTTLRFEPTTIAAIGLGTRLATSVYGRAIGTDGVGVDIQATADDRYLGRSGGALGFFQVAWSQLNLSGASLGLGGDLGGTTAAAQVVKIRGAAVSATAPVDNDILVYDSGTSAYIPGQLIVNRGEILTRNATEIIRLAPGAAGTILQAAGAAADLSWTNDPILGTDAAGGGTLKVYHAVGAYFGVETDGQVTVGIDKKISWGGGANPSVSGYTGAIHINADASAYIILTSSNIDIGGFTTGPRQYVFSVSSTTKIDYTFWSGTTGLFRIMGQLRVDGSLGFFGTTPVSKTAVTDPSAIVTTGTADATYSANEVTMLNDLKTDVTNLRTKLASVIDQLQAYGLF